MKITKQQLKQLIKEELASLNEMTMDPQTLIKMLCASETLGAKILQKMAEDILNDPTNMMVVLGPYKEQIEKATGMDLKQVVNMALNMEVQLPFLGAMTLKQGLDMAAQNPMVKNAMMGMIPAALQAACSGADQVEDAGVEFPGGLKLPFQESLDEALDKVLSEL